MESTWEKKWTEDIDYLIDNLINKHVNIFANTTKNQLDNRVNNLKAIINQLDYDEMKVEISRIVALIKDAHTAVIFPVSKYIPLKFYYFEDGVYIIDTIEEYKELLFKKVIAIENIQIEDILDDLRDIVSFENSQLFKAKSMKYLQAIDVLYGLLIIDNKESVNITIHNKNIEVNSVTIDKLLYTEYKKPLYGIKDNENLWYRYLRDKEELYIKYNSCRETTGKTIKEKINEIIGVVESSQIENITIDLRNNLGGDSTLISPLIEYIKGKESINTQENLKVVIGRETFSSGLLNAYEFKFETNAKIIGEPSGGKPNCYGEILKFTLPNSKFVITYSTKYFTVIEDDNLMTLEPDEFVLEKIEDFY